MALEEEETPRDLLLVAADLKFKLSLDRGDATTSEQLLEIITENKMVSFYEDCIRENLLEEDERLLGSMRKECEGLIQTAEEAIENADENQGETEVREAKTKLAQLLTYMKDKDTAVAAWENIQALSPGKKIDNALTLLRIALAYEDSDLFKRINPKCAELVEKGGDWDRRNRYFVYQGIQHLRERNFKTAAQLFLKVVPSFGATEVIDYNDFIFYTVLVNILHLDRVILKKKVIECPEIIQVIEQIDYLQPLLHSLYECNYNQYFQAVVGIMDQIKSDRVLVTHEKFLLHEYRHTGYDQFLRPYRSVTLKTMSDEFGLDVDFIEEDLCGFITEGRIKCAIDKVDGVVANRLYNERDIEYKGIVKRGDNLLNRMEKLSKYLLL